MKKYFFFANSFNNSTLLAEIATFQFSLANFSATALPIPLLAPVIQTFFLVFIHNRLYLILNMNNKYLSLGLIILVTFVASGIGEFVTSSFKEPWYSEIILPSFNPPSWVFGPVWTILYIFMSVAAWFAWNKTSDKKILQIYFIHLFFNSIWSIIFFGFHQIFIALIDLVIILIFIIWLMKIYYQVNKISFLLMTPYLLWSSYALILNGTIFYLN